MGIDEQFINLIREKPVLYNCRDAKYKDTVLKDNIWMDIAKKCNMTGKELIYILFLY